MPGARSAVPATAPFATVAIAIPARALASLDMGMTMTVAAAAALGAGATPGGRGVGFSAWVAAESEAGAAEKTTYPAAAPIASRPAPAATSTDRRTLTR